MKNNKMTREEKRRLLFNKKYVKENTQASKANFARPDESGLFLKTGVKGTLVRTPISKRMLAIILAIVFVLTVIPTAVFVGLRGRASNEEINNLGPVEMILRVNGEEQGTVQMQPGAIDDNIGSVAIENAPAKLEFEGAFMVDRGSTPVTETRITSVGSYQGNDYYSLDADNDTGIKRQNRQELVLSYSSEYTVTANAGEGGSIEVDRTVPYGTDLHVHVTAPKGNSINSVSYQIGEESYTATPNNDGDFTIPGSQVINDITITSSYSQIATFTVKDARKVQNSKYYNLYGLEGHGGITATIGVSAEGQPYDQTIFGGHDLYNDWTANKYQLFTPDAVLCSDKWGGTYTRNGAAYQVYGAPNTSVYAGYENITTNSNGTIKDIQPNSVSNGDSTTFYVYSQSKSGNSNGWGLNMLSINGVDINYPAGSTVGTPVGTDLDEDSHVTVTLISTDSPLYWNNGDLSYSYTTSTKYFAKSNKASYSSGDVASLWYYNAPSVNKHRYIYKIDIDHVQEDIEVAYNFKDVAKRQILITGLDGIDETGAAYEWSGASVNSRGNGIGLFESRNYYFTSAATPVTNNEDDLGYWQQNIYDAFFFEQYGALGVNFVPSDNVYAYRVKSGYNPYTVEARARYIDNDTITWVEGDDLLAGPREDSVGDLSTVLIRASEGSNARAREILENTNLPSSWIEEGGALDTWVTEYLSFNSIYRFWGDSKEQKLKHRDVSTRNTTASSSTHNEPVSSNTENKLFLSKIKSYEDALASQNIKNYKFYALALQENEAKDQLLQLNAHPYQYTTVFDANGGAFPSTLDNGYDRVTDGDFDAEVSYSFDDTQSVKYNRTYTLENGPVTAHMPQRSMTPERKGYFFAGWELYQNGAKVEVEDYDIVYSSNQAFIIDENSIDYAEGDVKKDVKHAFTFKAKWIAVAPESDMVNVSVSVYKQNGAGANDYSTLIDHAVERQVAGETVLLNQYKPAPEEYYSLNEAKSVIKTTTSKNSDETNPDNQLSAYFDYRTVDLDVSKRVTGNPKTLRDGFDITVKLTRDQNSPVNVKQALDLIAISNDHGIPVTTSSTSNTITYVGTFGRSDNLLFGNVPYGWTAEVSEAKAPIEDNKSDYETTITTDPEYGTVDDTAADKTAWTGRLTKDTDLTVTNASDSYLVLDKTLSRGENGTYTLTLDAFATGDVTSEVKTEKIPTDFVIIVDQSGSMAINDMATGFTPVTGNVNLEDAANGSYYYYDPDTKEHYKVYGKKGDLYHYYSANSWYVGDIIDRFNTRLSWFMPSSDSTTTFENQFFFREVVNGKAYYQPITTTVQGKIGTYGIRFHYDSMLTGERVDFNREVETYTNGVNTPWYRNLTNIGDRVIKPGWSVLFGAVDYNDIDGTVQGLYRDDNEYTFSEVSIFGWRAIETGMYVNYPMYDRHIGYTGLYYRDINGVEHALQTVDGKTKAEFCNDSGNNAWTTQEGSTRMRYAGLEIASGTAKRLDALDTALNAFAEEVANETDEVHGSVDNKIAIVGFSSKNDGTNYRFNNTEVLTGSPIDASQSHDSYSESNYYYFPYQGANYAPAGSTGTNYNGPQYYQYSSSNVGYTTAADATVYKNALVNSTNGTVGEVNSNITDAIKSISAWGGTKPADGFEMAYQILQNREVTTYKLSDGTVVPRNTFVIYFTDGRPGNYSYSDQYAEANAVIKSAKKVKDLGASVFSIGVFDESDGNPLTYSKYEVKNSQGTVTSRNRTDGYSSENVEKEFDLTWVETYHPDNDDYYYLNREWIDGNPGEYGETPNDTIADYMSVVSSNYPNAEGFTSDDWINYAESANWATMTASVRGNQITEIPEGSSDPIIVNKYYRMASNQDTLIEAFKSAISTYTEESSQSTTGMDGTSALLRDVINGDDFVIPDHDLTVNVYTMNGKQENDPGNDPAAGIVFYPNTKEPLTGAQVSWSDDHSYVDVSGFDYGANFIAYQKPPNETEGTGQHEGKKLIVEITGLVPKQNATGTLKSNTDDSGIYKLVAEEGSEEKRPLQMDAFISPTMERYKYNLTEPGEYSKDTFDITLKHTDTNSAAILSLYDEHGNRSYGTFGNEGTYRWAEAKHGDSIFFELLNEETNDSLQANVPDPTNEEYAYTMDLIDSQTTTPQNFDQLFALPKEESTIQVTNVSNLRDVTITEETKGVAGQADYSDRTKQFPIHMSLIKTDGSTPFNGNIEATITRKSGETETVTLRFGNDGELNNPNDVKLADGDKIDFQVLKDYTLKVWETESDADNYNVTYNPDEDEEDEGTEITIGDTNAVKVINTLAENPVITGFHGIDSKLNPFLIAAGVIALAGGAWLALIQYKRKKEQELAAYQAGKSE